MKRLLLVLLSCSLLVTTGCATLGPLAKAPCVAGCTSKLKELCIPEPEPKCNAACDAMIQMLTDATSVICFKACQHLEGQGRTYTACLATCYALGGSQPKSMCSEPAAWVAGDTMPENLVCTETVPWGPHWGLE
jgi:hypothetical protein